MDNEEKKEEKIEIVEHNESKFDDLKPRLEEAEISSNKEKKEPVKNDISEKETPPKKKKSSKLLKILIIIFIIFIAIGIYVYAKVLPEIKSSINTEWYKPIIYIYPEKTLDVNIRLSHPEKLTTTYPEYNDGWNIKALPDGTLIDKDNNKYYALYWESNNNEKNYIKEDGFVIKGEDTSKFLEEKLTILGLNYKESNEFIIYWLPKLEHNKYNYIRFMTRQEIDNNNSLDITPKPDTLIRIMMEYKPLTKKSDVKEQVLNKVERKGYTVVEWGGTVIK